MDDEDKITILNILEIVGFSHNIPKRGLQSARRRDVLYSLPKPIAKVRKTPLPSIEEISDDDLKGREVKKTIPSNKTDIYTRLELSLGVKLSGHTDTLTEACNLNDELYKRDEIQNEQQYQNALDKFQT